MITLEFVHAGGFVIADYLTEDYVSVEINRYKEYALHDPDYTIHLKVSNILIFAFFRMAVLKKKMSHKDIKFLYCGDYFEINEFGNFIDWPKNYPDIHLKLCEEIIMKQVQMERSIVYST